jgi:hypothetical protein
MYSLACNLTAKENASLYRRQRPKRWLVVRESTSKYHYLTMCIFQLMEAGGRDIEVGLLLCMYDCGASILFVQYTTVCIIKSTVIP